MYFEEDLELKYSYKTYFNYFQSLTLLLPENKKTMEEFVKISENRTFLAIKKNKLTDKETSQLSRWLHLSWNAEVLLQTKPLIPEMVNLTNLWAPVQLYYSLFSAIQALLISENASQHSTHTAILRTFANKVSDRSALFLQPWQVTCGQKDGRPIFKGLPSGCTTAKISNFTQPSPENCWQYLQMLLKTTSDRELNTSKKEWRAKCKKKKIPKNKVNELEEKLSKVTILDFLYRLRIRCNYYDSQVFTSGTSSVVEGQKLNDAISQICRVTLTNIELLIAKYIGNSIYSNLLDNFFTNAKKSFPSLTFNCINRWDYLKKIISN